MTAQPETLPAPPQALQVELVADFWKLTDAELVQLNRATCLPAWYPAECHERFAKVMAARNAGSDDSDLVGVQL